MRLLIVRLLLILSCFVFHFERSGAQSCIPTNINGTTINLACNQTCSTFVFQIPHIKGTGDYVLTSIPYNPYPYLSATGSESPNIYADDQYGDIVNIPFPFCFYDSVFNKFVVGSNGLITFDIANANCGNGWQTTTSIPSSVGALCSNTLYYPKAAIMPAYSDLDPRTPVASPADRKIQWHVEGTAPCRKYVISFYHIGVFGNTCGLSTPNTFQIVLHESTGIIEYFFEQKACFSSTNSGLAIMGVQDWTRTKAVWYAGRNPGTWSENNKGYRLTPSGAGSRFVSSELDDLAGNLIIPADTLTTTPGLLDIRFPNFCPPAGNNTYVVKTIFSACDNPANQLISYDTIQVNRTNSLNATATTTAATCGPPNGTITVTVPPGVGTSPFTYVLDANPPVTGPSPYTFNNVAGGTHTIVVTDASGGCSSTVTVNVTVSGNISATTATTSTSCLGLNDGSITITSATGTGPYRFSIDGGPQIPGTLPFTFSNLSSGNHTIAVYDLGTGCNTGTMTVFVPTGIGVTANVIPSPTSCSSTSNGSITVTALTGTAPFTFQLDGGAIQTGPNPFVFTNVSAGPHTVTVRDFLGCSIPITVTVTAGASLTANISNTATACTGVANGTITVNVLNGSAPYTFRLDANPPQSGPNPFTFTNVAAGTHTITVTDATGCSSTASSTVAVGAGVTGTVSSTSTACSGVSNGTITVNATSGTAPFTYQLDVAPPQSGSNPYTFTNVSSGSHTITVTDNVGCTFTTTATVSVGAGVTGNVTSTPTSCQVSGDGTITANATSGTAPFTYQLDGGAPQSGTNPYTFTNVVAGTHTVVIRDNFGCTFTDNNVVVAPGPPLSGNVTSTATSCSGATNGSVTVTATSGTAPFQFALDGGAPVSGASPHTFTNVPAGSHTVVITDASGCTSNPLSVNVTAGPPLTTTVNKTDVACFGDATGSITVTIPTIGTPPYEYSLDNINWQGSNVFTGLVAGTYTVYYRESNGCQGFQSVTIGQPAAALSASSTTVPVVCNGQSNGTITVTASGGTAPYEYSLDGGVYQSNNVFNTTAGTHNISIRDANGCTTPNTITVTEPAALTATTNIQDASCNGGPDGIITITASGGNPGYQYSIDGVNFKTVDSFHVPPGTYTITIKDNLGCTTTKTETIAIAQNLTVTPQSDQTICEGTSTQLQLTSNATQYAWSPSTGLSDPNISNPVADPTTTTQYVVTATLDRCSANDTIIVTVNAAPIPNAGPDGFICYGQSYQLQASGGTSFSWTPATDLSSASGSNPISNPKQTTTYTLSVIDANGCNSLTTDNVTVDVTPPIKVNTFPRDTILYSGDKVQLLATSAGNIYNWSPATGLDNPNIPNPIVTAGPMGDVVLYTVTASTIAGCQGIGYVKVQVYKGPDIYMPTAFTPNNDGKNDIFKPFTVGIEKLNYFKVFNRWGQMIYSTTTLNEGWNGKLSSIDQPSGVYVWMVQGVTKDGRIITKRGTIVLIR